MRVIIAGKRFEVKTEITEFTIKDLVWANPLLAKVDYSFKWCMDWLLNASDIPLEYLERLDLEHDLKPICEVSVLGLRTPDTYLEQDFIKLDGKKYEKRKELETLSGMRIFLGNNNYKQFSLMGQMYDILAKSKDINPIALASINAVLYGEDFTDKAIEERTKLFMDLPLLVAYSGFFLFKKDLSKYSEFLSVSSEMRVRVVEKLDKSFRILSSKIFGWRLLTRLQVRECLLRLTKAL
jgi:hypothetical protein